MSRDEGSDPAARLIERGHYSGPKASGMHATLELQHHVCTLCGRGPRGDEEISYWHADHDHQCCQPWDFICGGCVRCFLCTGCNMRGVAWYEATSDRPA
ncbi:endonuclease domain-containing protein [Streptomyces anulatus]|uniref:endonuclease domain-containing protein n=1 Tax=Streptomyces anulatus TaxID=1892 RepID=UPI003868212F